MEERLFPKQENQEAVETGEILQPKFDENGLIPCIVTDVESKNVLMLAYMNAESLAKSIETGQAWYWSRSRQALWRKGSTSGQTQTIARMSIDCDQDTLWIEVRVGGDGGTCHRGYPSCFYRRIPLDEKEKAEAQRLIFG